MKMIEVKGNQDPNTLKLSKPTLRFTYDAFLALHEANVMRATGRTTIRPLSEVSEINPEWESDVITEIDHLKYLEDYHNGLDPALRALLEKPAQEGEA